ncbi:MAG: CcmD family protein [Bacillota bacterium]
MIYTFLAFTIAWLIISGYLYYLGQKQSKLEKQIEILQEILKEDIVS